MAATEAQLSNSTVQQLRQLCTTSYSGCTLSWAKAASTLFPDDTVQKQIAQLRDESIMCLLSASVAPPDGSDALITQVCTNTTSCERITVSMPADKTYTAKLCMYRGHADSFLSDKQLVGGAQGSSATATTSATAKQCMLKYLQKAAADSAGTPLATGSPALVAALRAILQDCWSASYAYVGAARSEDPEKVRDLLDNMLAYDRLCRLPPAAAPLPTPLPAPAGSPAAAPATETKAVTSLQVALDGANDTCARFFLQQMPELKPEITPAVSATCGAAELRNLDNCCQSLKEPLNLDSKNLFGQLPANFTMAPLGTILYNNPSMCGGLGVWPSDAALKASDFGGGKYKGYSAAEAVLLRYVQQNSSQLVLFGLYNSKVTLDLEALSPGAPFYFTAVIIQHLGRGFVNANNLRGLPNLEQGVMACQLLQGRSVSVYGESNSQVPEFSLFLQSEAQLQRSSGQWQRHLEAQGGSNYMCGDAGRSYRGKQIGYAFAISVGGALVLGALKWVVVDRLKWIDPNKHKNTIAKIKLLVTIGMAVYDNVGDWQWLKQLADSGSGFLLIAFGLLLWASVFISTVAQTYIGARLKMMNIRLSNEKNKPNPPVYYNSSLWYKTLVVLQVYSWIVLPVSLIVVLVHFKNLNAFSTCIKNQAALCKPQTQRIFNIILGATLPALIAMHLWPLACLGIRLLWSDDKEELLVDALEGNYGQSQKWSEFMFFATEDLPQFGYQTYVWYSGQAYITEQTYLFSAVGSIANILLYMWKLYEWQSS